MSAELHFITSWQDRHERIANIADVLDESLARQLNAPYHTNRSGFLTKREIHQLRGLCEQLRCDAEGIRLGTDGSKGTKEVQA